MSAVLDRVRVVDLGLSPYESTVAKMREFTARRDSATADELWLLEHPPVYTLGLGADPVLGARVPKGIPLVKTDRGGEITYHGPGQVVLYTLVDLARRALKVKRFVWMLEQSVIDLLGGGAARMPGAPGVYVQGAKIAALGIRVSRGCAYHGLALNVDLDLAPFAAIDACGRPGLPVTRTRDLGFDFSVENAGRKLAAILTGLLEHA
ncbi:MAG: lipoyl(octanoyl) transferase LipB [Betaproteobacteria bacterium]|nr:lipoyl(octanoyl) transferase LipB [Betaproteobacteria bacterium]